MKSIFTTLLVLCFGSLFAQEEIKISKWNVGANLGYMYENYIEKYDGTMDPWGLYEYREKSHAPMFSLFINRSFGKSQKWNVELGVGYAVQFLKGTYDSNPDAIPNYFTEKQEILQPYVTVRYLLHQSSNTLWMHYAGVRVNANMYADEFPDFYTQFPSMGIEYLAKYTLSKKWNLQMGANYNYYNIKMDLNNSPNPFWGPSKSYSNQLLITVGLAYRF